MARLLDKPDAPHPAQDPALAAPSLPEGAGPTPRVSVADAAPGAGRLLPVLEVYARALETKVTLHIPAAHHRRPCPPTGLHVHCFALPRRPVVLGVWPRVPLVRLPFAFGHPLPAGNARAFAPGHPMGRGRVLADADGRIMVEVAGANLYIVMDLLAQGDFAPILLRRSLDLGLTALAALPRISPLPADARAVALVALVRGTVEAEAAWRARTQGESRRRFQAEVDLRRQDETHRLQREIDHLEEALEDQGRRITADTRAVADFRRRLRILQDLPAASAAAPLAEFDRIRDLPEVSHVEVQGGAIAIITQLLEAECAGHRYRLGAFRVEIHFDGDVRITNVTDRRGPYEHPHIRQGRPCLGNVREGVAKLIGEFEFAAAAQVLIDFLQTVNPQDWRIPVFYWPRVEP